MTLPFNAFQAVIVSLLEDLKDLNSAVVPVHDEVPDKPTYPYVELGGYESETDLSSDFLSYSVSWEINVYSKYAGSKEANDILGQIAQRFKKIPTGLGFRSMSEGLTESITVAKEVGSEDELIRKAILRHKWRIYPI